MSDAIRGLAPALLWEQFSRLSAIPRPSRKEHQASLYISDLAASRGLAVQRDAAGNLLVRKPASRSATGAPSVVLQSHLDMVCERRRDVNHDFERDGIRLARADGYLMADGTTLGADNGIGAAAALAVMLDEDIPHGPLEFLFTVDEETGLNGASALDPSLLTGRLLLNLDSEEEGALYIGCAGSRGAYLSSPAAREPAPEGFVPITLTLSGLQGGHSGLDIAKIRANAIRLIVRALWVLAARFDIRVARVSGGSKRNAIPREAEAVLFIPGRSIQAFGQAVDEQNALLWGEWGSVAEPHLSLSSGAATPMRDGTVIVKADQQRLLSLLYALPTGVIGMSAAMPGSVETSLNLAIVRTEEKAVLTEISMRSSVDSALEDIAQRVAVIGRLAGSAVDLTTGYPGWRPDPTSPLLHLVASSYRAVFARDPEIKVIHAGLECAVIGGKCPGIDMISFGPTIEGAHSPDERVHVESVERFWQLLTTVLTQLSQGGVFDSSPRTIISSEGSRRQ